MSVLPTTAGPARTGLTLLRERVESAMRARLAPDAMLAITAEDELDRPLADVAALAPGARALLTFSARGDEDAAERLRSACDARGVRIDAAVPAGMLLGSLVPQRRLTGTACAGFAWDNLLSWTASDEAFCECVVFLETELLAALPLAASDRMTAVLANLAGPARNAAWLADQSRRAAHLANGLMHEAFARENEAQWGRLRAVLSHHLAYEPNVAFIHRLLSVAQACGLTVRPADFSDAAGVARLEGYMRVHDADAALNAMIAVLYEDPQVRAVLQFEDIDIGLPLDYDAMVDLTAALLPQLPDRVRA